MLKSASVNCPLSRLCTRKPPNTDLTCRPSAAGSGICPVSRTRRLFFSANRDRASASASGAMITSMKIDDIAIAVTRSKERLQATIPPNALTGSAAKACSHASASLSATATPQGLACLTIAMAGSVNSLTRRRAASVSLILL